MDRRHFLLTSLAAASGVQARDALPERFDPARDAEADLAGALAIATATGRRVIVDVGGEWCAWCHVMDRFIRRETEVRTLLDKHFVWLKLNYSSGNRNARTLGRWPPVTGYPHLFVLAATGELLASQTTSELEGRQDYDKAKFLRFLRTWV